jgi:hypothetical protein
MPTAPHCALPLYWPAPPFVVSTLRGMHRFSWDLHFDPLTVGDTVPNDDDQALGAVPHRTYTTANSPWTPPGKYTVRLTVGGQQYTQPLVLRLDPRVKTSAAGLTELATLSRDLYDRAVTTHAAYLQARTMSASLDASSSLRAQIDSLAPPPARGGRRGGFGRRGGAGGATQTLNAASDALLAAAMAMQNADVAPTASELAAADRARAQANAVMARWNTLRNAAPRRSN